MRRLTAGMLLLAVTATAAGCSREEKPPASKAFCRAADRWNDEIERTAKRGKPDVERQLPLVEDLARTAPEEIKDDAERFADAMRRRAEGDTSVVDDPAINEAVDNVNRYANQACGVYERRGL